MAILNWVGTHTTKAHYVHEPVDFDIHDWRALREGKVYSKQHGRRENGLLISAKENIRFVPHFTIKELLNLNKQGRKVKHTQYHFGYRSSDMALTYCHDCRGVGKFDWIQQTSPARHPIYGEAPKHFTRDEDFYYALHNFSSYLFAKVKLEPGDTYCTVCHGFGIELDARFKIFKGMVGIKKRLVKIKSSNY